MHTPENMYKQIKICTNKICPNENMNKQIPVKMIKLTSFSVSSYERLFIFIHSISSVSIQRFGDQSIWAQVITVYIHTYSNGYTCHIYTVIKWKLAPTVYRLFMQLHDIVTDLLHDTVPPNMQVHEILCRVGEQQDRCRGYSLADHLRKGVRKIT